MAAICCGSIFYSKASPPATNSLLNRETGSGLDSQRQLGLHLRTGVALVLTGAEHGKRSHRVRGAEVGTASRTNECSATSSGAVKNQRGAGNFVGRRVSHGFGPDRDSTPVTHAIQHEFWPADRKMAQKVP